MEKEIAAVLKGSSGLLERRNKELTESEERALQAVDLQEVRLMQNFIKPCSFLNNDEDECLDDDED